MPFESQIAVRVAEIRHRQMEHEDKEIQLTEITFEIHPLSPELAGELDDFVKRTLYTMKDAEVTSKLTGASFNLGIRPQEIAVRMAPDQGKASFVIEEAKIGTFHARRSKKSSAWRLVFTATCAPSSEHQLSQIVDSYLKSRFLQFANATAGLFDEIEQEERKASKAAKPVRPNGSGETATAH